VVAVSAASFEHGGQGSEADTFVLATTEQQTLQQLWNSRTRAGGSDYALGPGDVLQISVAAVNELKERTVRIAGDGTISLPYVGTVKAAGLTEQQLTEKVTERLQKYLYQPQVDLFAKDYRSRQVAVIGAVDKPGLYDLSSSSDSILTMLSRAGGLARDAAQRVLVIPAKGPEPDQTPPDHYSNLAQAALSKEGLRAVLKQNQPIVIDLNNLDRGGGEGFLALPARPGDIIMIPTAGEVLVQGWVDKPGPYKITPGLTLLGAVAAAGGTQFPASSDVTVIRSTLNGEKTLISANLSAIQKGTQADIPVEEADVVNVSYSTVKMIPYGVFSLIGKGLYMGATAPIF
jgi:polysaccharide export outer membrane protein